MRLVRLLYSLRLALFLFILLVLLVAIGGLLPQGGAPEVYRELLPSPLAGLVLLMGLDRTFSSPLFLGVAALFLLNLAACTLRRFAGELKRQKGRRSFGPDILHLGILVLAVGGLMTAVGREERTLLFTPGEQRGIDQEYRVTLTNFEYQRYPSGAPKDWISHVRIHRNGELYREQVRIEVNDPLRLGPYTLYQVQHAHRPVARFTDGESREYRVIAGHWKELGDAHLLFAAVPEGSGNEIPHGMFMLREGMQRSARRLAPGDRIFGLELKEMEHSHISGLKVVRDPGYRLVLIGFVLAGLGLMLTYIVKIIKVREDS